MARSVQQIAAHAHVALDHDDSEMNNILKILSAAHKNPDHDEIPYNKPRYQAAYMYLYFSSLCHSVKHGLDLFNLEPDAWNIGQQDNPGRRLELNVCSIGGGPGTDVLGFCRYMRSFVEENREFVLNATIIDKYYEWEEAWNVIKNANENQEEVAHINMEGYIGYDIRKPAGRFATRCVIKANVILMFKFVSAVKGLLNFKQNLTNLLRNASAGSYLIYGDNSGGGFTKTFRDIAQNAGFRNVKEELQHKKFKIPDDGALVELDGRYDQNHQKNLAMTFMLLRKQPPLG